MKKNLISLTLLFFLSLSLSACLKTKDQPNFNQNQNQNANQAEAPILSQADLEKNYQAAIKAAFLPYWQKQDITGIKEKVLALRAPAKFLDLHFNLVVAFELLEQGKSGANQEKVEAGMEKLNALKAEYPWLNE